MKIEKLQEAVNPTLSVAVQVTLAIGINIPCPIDGVHTRFIKKPELSVHVGWL